MDHVAVTVNDTAKAMELYVDLLGLTVVERHELPGESLRRLFGIDVSGGSSTRLQAPDGGPLIDLMELHGVIDAAGVARPIGRIGSSHVAFSTPDVFASYRDLVEAGVDVLAEPVEFALENGDVTTVCFLRDADGNHVELESTVYADGR